MSQQDRRKRWEVVAPSDAAALASELELPPAIAGILIARGIRTAEAAQMFLHPSLNDLHDPLLLRDMPIAIDRLRRAIAAIASKLARPAARVFESGWVML